MNTALRFCLFALTSAYAAVVSAAVVAESSSGGPQDMAELEAWQRCEVFLSPSEMGWGVFAAREFAQNEIVQLAPLFVLMGGTLDSNDDDKVRRRAIKNSVLDDYVYGYNWNGVVHSNVIFGMDMFFNHHPQPNIEYVELGSYTGFSALREIQAGEQLFSTYGHLDGGIGWFHERGIDMQAPPASQIGAEELPDFVAELCSKIYAGPGLPSWSDPFGHWTDAATRLAPSFDAGLGEARAKRPIATGETVEIGSGLLLSRKLYQGTPLAPLLIYWDDLNETQKRGIRMLRNTKRLRIKGPDTTTNTTDAFQSFEDLAIAPVAGNMALVRRGHPGPTNCRLVIHWQAGAQNSFGLALELIATQNIGLGEVLSVDMPKTSATKAELLLLKEQMDDIGQVYHESFFSEESATCTHSS